MPKLESAPLEPLAKAEPDKTVAPQGANGAKADAGQEAGPASATEARKAERAPSAETKQAAVEVGKQLAEAFKADKIGAGVSAEATDKGVVISITDQFDFGMFEIGSAVPSRELVLAMEKIGRIVNGQKGNIVIQGHTDARPFRSDTYDNWRLSTARAHSAYYMLVRGGVDEQRITEVAGFADREPKDKADPLAAVNRRIEILLETDG
jgi:chemotaxis protein MotB